MNHGRSAPVVVLVSRDALPEAAAIVALLSDRHSREATAVVRVVAEYPDDFVTLDRKCAWKCHEQSHDGDRWTTYFGTPDLVLPLSCLKDALSGRRTNDDGARAHSVVVCVDLSKSSGRKILQFLLRSIAQIEQDENVSCGIPFAICYTGSFRELFFFSSCMELPGACNVGLGAFASSLRYNRIVKKGLVLSASRIRAQAHFLITQSFQNMPPWNETIGLICPRSRPVIHQVQGGMTKSPSNSPDACTRILLLQDPSILLHPCILASEVLSKQEFPGATSARVAMKLVISMLEELYRLFARIIGTTRMHNVGLLADLVGSQVLVRVTGNTEEEIIQRIWRNARPIRYSRLLSGFILTAARADWTRLTRLFCLPRDKSPSSKERQKSFARKSIEGGLLHVIALGVLLGMIPQNDFATTTRVVTILQPYLGKSYLQISNNYLQWNQSDFPVGSMCPPFQGPRLPERCSPSRSNKHTTVRSKL